MSVHRPSLQARPLDHDIDGNPSILPSARDGTGDLDLSRANRQLAHELTGRKYAFNWFLGVYVPAFVNLICVTYFMDLHRSVKQIGWGYRLL